MEALNRMFSDDKWNYRLRKVPGGYEAMVELHFNPGEIDRGMGEGRLPEIAILHALDLAIINGFAKGEKSTQGFADNMPGEKEKGSPRTAASVA